MNPQNPVKSCVKRRMLDGKEVADALSALTTTCNAGALCADVQSDPVSAAAQVDLQAKVTAASACLVVKQKADQDATAAGKNLFTAFQLVRASLATYEMSVNGIAKGDAAVIHKAGCDSRPEAPSSPPAVAKVAKVTYTLGKGTKESVLRWPETPGAAMFAVEVNYDPSNPAAPWTSLGTTTRRTKLVTVANPSAQFLARIGALDSDGKAADWSDTILATAR
jgi:hypothetical protein